MEFKVNQRFSCFSPDSTTTNGHRRTDPTAFLKWLQSEVTFFAAIGMAHLEMLLCAQCRVEMFRMYRAVALKRPSSHILFKQLNLRLEYQYHQHFKNAIQTSQSQQQV